MSLKVANLTAAPAFKAQETQPKPESKPQSEHQSGVNSAAVLTGSAAGMLGGGALGAFGYAKPAYKNIDEVFKAHDLAEILESAKNSSDAKVKEFSEVCKKYREECSGYKEYLDKNFKDEAIPLEDFKKFENYDDACKAITDFEARAKKINDFLDANKAKEFTKEAFETALKGAIESPTEHELQDLMSYLDSEGKGTFTILDDHVQFNKAIAELDANHLKNNKAFLEMQFKLAKDGKISKQALVEFHNTGYMNSFLEAVEKPTKARWYNAIEKHIPTKKLKPGLIGAAIGAIAAGAAVAIYSKMDDNSKKSA